MLSFFGVASYATFSSNYDTRIAKYTDPDYNRPLSSPRENGGGRGHVTARPTDSAGPFVEDDDDTSV